MIDDSAFYDRNAGLNVALVPELNKFLQAPFNDDEVSRLSTHLDAGRAAAIAGSKPAIRDLPDSYLELLAISCGGGIAIGEREIAYFESEAMRDYLIDYQFPVYMPGGLPFGLNGGGVFYVFDMRAAAVAGEFPILAVSSGNLGYDDAPMIAGSIQELLADPTNIEDYCKFKDR